VFLAVAAQKFGCRPSELVRLRDPVLALDFDLAAAARLLAAERHAANSAAADAGGESSPRAAREIRW
jgi:hypothetical protein